ncbi:MAG: hypothetical protein IIU85_03495 [Rikenellaceae bacterium]|nr:hypothetical protein [Rikenellaceae bacterium]
MKRLLTLLMLLSMTACEKYDWAPQLESGEIDLTRSTIEGYWKCSVKNIIEYYDASGEFIDYERLIGGAQGDVNKIYNVYRITSDEIWHLYYARCYIPVNPKDPKDPANYYYEKFFRKYPMQILSDGEVVTAEDFSFLAGWCSVKEYNEARITKMNGQQIIMYIKIDYKEEQTDQPKGTKYAYRKFVFDRVYPDEGFFEIFADELK